ncbi:ankyrin-1-like [Lineus longissimus]|uniref:ankyrin-1-like n=1 Tax=Lineus longissimus TaxID=88925 RepID=UPI002B4F90EB
MPRRRHRHGTVHQIKRNLYELALSFYTLEEGIASMSSTKLFNAVERGDLVGVEKALQNGCETNQSRHSIHGSALHLAAKAGHAEIIDCLLSHGADIHNNDSERRTPLHYACARGHDDVVDIFLKHGAKINFVNSDQTPLHMACEAGHIHIIRRLLFAGADVNCRSTDAVIGPGVTPLYIAYIAGQTEAYKTLIENGAKKYEQLSELHQYIFLGNEIQVDRILSMPNGMRMVNTTDKDGRTPLHVACGMANYGIVKMLLRIGVEVNCRDKLGKTPLHYAASHCGVNLDRRKRCVYLAPPESEKTPSYSSDEDHDIPTSRASSPRRVAVKIDQQTIQDYVSISKMLLRKGAFANLLDNGGQTPLHMACREGKLGLAEVFIAFGADIEIRDKVRGQCALHLACLKPESYPVTELLIKAGAKLNIQDKHRGDTPLHIATKGNCLRSLELLLKAHSKTDIPNDESGYTALHISAIHGYYYASKMLLEHGANTEIKEKNWKHSPLQMALRRQHYHQMELLIKYGADVDSEDKWGYSSFSNVLVNFINKCGYGNVSIETYQAVVAILVNAGCALGDPEIFPASMKKMLASVYEAELLEEPHTHHGLTKVLLASGCGILEKLDPPSLVTCLLRNEDDGTFLFARRCGYYIDLEEISSFLEQSRASLLDDVGFYEPLRLKDICRIGIREVLYDIQKRDTRHQQIERRPSLKAIFQKASRNERRSSHNKLNQPKGIQIWRIKALPLPMTLINFLSFETISISFLQNEKLAQGGKDAIL